MDLLTAIRDNLPAGASARQMSDTIINIYAPGREVTPEDLAAARVGLAAAGYEEARSWIATEGMSWLSDGTRSVSIEAEPRRNP